MVTQMNRSETSIDPDEIRAIRERLGLSQVEAGELLGGGPRAFTKYEAGSIRPRASVVRLLRVLDANPAALASLRDGESPPAPAPVVLPFDVTSEHIERLTAETFPQLLRRVLSAEAQANRLPQNGIHVAISITTADGGEDGRIQWNEGPPHTPFLQSRFTQFQLKAGKVSPSAAAHEVAGRNGVVKPMVRSALAARGYYVLLCAHPYTYQQIERRESQIRAALRDAGMDIDDEQVAFRGADWIVDWVNRHPSVAAWLKQQTGLETPGPFRSWLHWEGRPEHAASRWVADDRLSGLREPICEAASGPRGVVRVVGPAGVGKSRLILEALRPSEADESLAYSVADLVLYADESEAGALAINGVVQTLAEHGQRAVVVVDRCSPDTHRILAGMVQRDESSLSLITIDDEIPSELRNRTIVEVTEHETVVRVTEAPSSVTEGIISSEYPGLPSEDFRRLAHFSEGFPKIARLVSQAWAASRSVAYATDEHLAETFILGRGEHDRDLLVRSARLLAAFRLVRMDHPDGDDLAEVASRGQNLGADDLHGSFNRLIDRGVARRRGWSVTLQPRPIALRLAEQQWRDWRPAQWEDILAGEASPELKVEAAKQLALLNSTDTAQGVVKHLCKRGGPFDGAEGIGRPKQSEVLSALAEIDVSLVADQIGRSLQDIPDLHMVRDDVRRHLVWALDKISFHPDGFEEGAQLLLRLALAENESWANNATGQFVGLFPVVLGNTAANGPARLSLLRVAAQSTDPAQRKIIAEALVNGSSTDHFARSVGSETHGSRPALASWHPATRDEALAYIQGCTDLLVKFATGEDDAAAAARAGLGRNLPSLISSGFIGLVEAIVDQIGAACDSWPEALEALGNFLSKERQEAQPEIANRVRVLMEALEPREVDARVRFLVTEMSWDYLCEEEEDHERMHCRQVDAVREFANELLRRPDVLRRVLPEMSRHPKPREGRYPQRMTCPFGEAMAEFADSPLQWLDSITHALCEVPENDQDFDLLSGYLVGISNDYRDEVERFKERAAESDVFAPALPLVCWRLGIGASDIDLVLSALAAGRLPPWRLMQWTLGGRLDQVEAHAIAPLFDALLDHSAHGYVVALELIRMYAFQREEVLEGLRPQLRKAAENLTQWDLSGRDDSVKHHLGKLMQWLLDKGREDTDARAAALSLARALASDQTSTARRIVEPAIRLLLAGFPEISWQVIGQAMLSDPVRAWNLGYLLGSRTLYRERANPAILSLPEDVLFVWCRANPDGAPALTATLLPVLEAYNRDAQGQSLHPWMVRLLEEFGDRDDVLSAVGGNIHSYAGWGPPTDYYALHEAPLSNLRDEHSSARVRRWARAILREIAAQSEGFLRQDDEWKARHEG